MINPMGGSGIPTGGNGGGFLGLDWGWDNLKNRGKGLLANPGGLLENPWFRAGMGILSENRKPFGGDPFNAGMLQGFADARLTKEQREDRERIKKLREELAEWMKRQGGGAYPPGVMAPGGGMMTPVPNPQRPQLMDYYNQ